MVAVDDYDCKERRGNNKATVARPSSSISRVFHIIVSFLPSLVRVVLIHALKRLQRIGPAMVAGKIWIEDLVSS